MINTDDFIKCLKMNNFSPFIGVPCSYLKPLISCLELNYSKDYINAVNEGNAVSYAFGSALAGKKPVILMVPVNLRKIFPSDSMLNFFSYIEPGYRFGEGKDSFDDVLEATKQYFEENLS